MLTKNLKCDQCGMLFVNSETLRMHKLKFCIGLQDSGVNRVYSANNQGSNQNADSHEFNANKAQNVTNKVKEYKVKKSIEQSFKDLEDTLVRDTIRDRRLASTLSSKSASALNAPNQIQPAQTTVLNDPFKSLFKEENSFKSDFLSLYENTEFDEIDLDFLLESVDFSPSSPFKTTMSDETIRNLRRIQDKTVQLEKERRAELKEQQRINEAALNMLRQRLYADNQQPVPGARSTSTFGVARGLNNTHAGMKSSLSNGSLPSLYGNDQINSLPPNLIESNLTPEEIRKMRLNYLQSGGHDQSILNRFTEMEYEARVRESNRFRPNQLNNNSSKESDSRLNNYEPRVENDIIKTVLNGLSNEAGNVGSSGINSELNGNYQRWQPIRQNSNNSSENTSYYHRMIKNDLRQNGYNNGANLNNSFSVIESKKSYEDVAPMLVSDVLTEEFKKTSTNHDLDEKIRRVDLENKRLQMEIESLQEKYQNLSSRAQPPANNSANYEKSKRFNDTSLPPIRQTSMSHHSPTPSRIKYVPVHEQIPNLVSQSQNPQYTEASAYRSQATFRADPPPATNRLNKLKDLPPGPYDPVGGFVIFIDFITNLDQLYGCARVITCLHHPKSGLGEPSVLPIVNCETYVENGLKTSVALVSTKQPVPRCPPQQALTILIELQMAPRDNNETKLKSCAWTKIPLFDAKNRLLSGRWRAPLKNLPIKSDIQMNYLNSVPDYDNTEIFYRLVNLRDSDEQTHAPISPAYASQYSDTSQLPLDNNINNNNNKTNRLYQVNELANENSEENIKYLNSPESVRSDHENNEHEKNNKNIENQIDQLSNERETKQIKLPKINNTTKT